MVHVGVRAAVESRINRMRSKALNSSTEPSRAQQSRAEQSRAEERMGYVNPWHGATRAFASVGFTPTAGFHPQSSASDDPGT